jgi:hypothetical protein
VSTVLKRHTNTELQMLIATISQPQYYKKELI